MGHADLAGVNEATAVMWSSLSQKAVRPWMDTKGALLKVEALEAGVYDPSRLVSVTS